MEKTSLTKETVLRWFLYLLIFAWWLKWGIMQTNDSQGYVDMVPSRSLGYPVFIKITTLFGLIHGQFFTLLVALVLQLFVLHRFVNFLKTQFNFSIFSVISVTILFLLPDFILFVANGNMTECISYPLFLGAIHLLLKALFNKNEKAAISYLFVTMLLILVRSQFLFMHVISFLLIVYLVWYSKGKIGSSLRLFGLFIVSLVCIVFSDRLYHLVVHHRFAPTQFTGAQLIVPALFIMQPKDTVLFNTPVERGVVDTVLSALKNNEFRNDFKSGYYSDNMVFRYDHLYIFYQFKTTFKYLSNVMRKKGLNPEQMEFWADIDNITMPMAIKLIKAHKSEYLSLYFNQFKESMGYTAVLIPFMLFFLLSIILFLVKGDNLSIFLVVTCLLVLLNNALVCIISVVQDRYLFYTKYLFFAFIVVAAISAIETGFNKSAVRKPDAD